MTRILFLVGLLLAAGVSTGMEPIALGETVLDHVNQHALDADEPPSPDIGDVTFSVSLETPQLAGAQRFPLVLVAGTAVKPDDTHPIRAPPCCSDNTL